MIAMDPSNHITNDNYVTAGLTDATTLESTTSSFQSYVEYDISKWMLLLYRPLCCVFGVTGNALCVIVLTTSSLRHSPSAVYLVTLSVLDFVISVYAGLDLLLKEMGETQFFTQSWHCKLFYFTILFCAHWDTLTLVFMTSQRFVAVRFPLQAASWLTKKAALVSIVFAGVIAFIANLVHLVTLEIQPSDGSYRARCEATDELGRILENNVFPWVDFTLYFFFPSASIVVLNLLIYKALRDARRFQSNANGAAVAAVAATTSATVATTSAAVATTSSAVASSKCQCAAATSGKRRGKPSSEDRRERGKDIARRLNSSERGGTKRDDDEVREREGNNQNHATATDCCGCTENICRETPETRGKDVQIAVDSNEEATTASNNGNVRTIKGCNEKCQFQRPQKEERVQFPDFRSNHVLLAEGSSSGKNKTSCRTDKPDPLKLIHQEKDNRNNYINNDLGEFDNDDAFNNDRRPIARKNDEDGLSIIRVILKTQRQSHTERGREEKNHFGETRHRGDALEMFTMGSRVSFDPSLGYVSDSHSLVEADDDVGKSKTESSAEFLSHISDPGPALPCDSVQHPSAARPKRFSLLKRAHSCCLCDCSTPSRSDSSQEFCENCSSVSTVDSDKTFAREKRQRWSSTSVGKHSCSFISSSDDDSSSHTPSHNGPFGGSHQTRSKTGNTSSTFTVLSNVSGSSSGFLATVSSRSMSSPKPKQEPNSKTPLSPLRTPSTLSSRPAASSTVHVTSTSRQLTLMLMTVSVAFLLLTLPLGVFVVVFRLIWNPTSGHEKASFGLFRGIAESLMYTNHAVNLILYWMAGTKFRMELKRLLCQRRRYCRLRARDGKTRTVWRISQAAHATSSAWS